MNTIKKIFILMVCMGGLTIIESCTNLDEEVFDKVPSRSMG